MSGINWPLILIGISVLTMTLGNIAALTQNNLKRMLAYSSIAHAGYIMMGVVVLNGDGLRAILLYLVVYLFMNLGAFLVVTIIYNSDRTFDIEGYNGMFKRAPFLSVAMSIFMLSLIGIPPFAGFLGKLYIFGAVIQKGLIWFAVVGALNAAVAAYYYMRVMKAMIIEEGDGNTSPVPISLLNQGLLVALLLPNILLTVFWNPIQRWALSSVRSFRRRIITNLPYAGPCSRPRGRRCERIESSVGNGRCSVPCRVANHLNSVVLGKGQRCGERSLQTG